MKKTINGKRYDTDKSTEVASHSDGYGGDFRAYHESIYRSPRGRWFLAGRGGPMTRWAERTSDGGMTGGSGILPLLPKDALEWLFQTDNDQCIEQYPELADLVEDT